MTSTNVSSSGSQTLTVQNTSTIAEQYTLNEYVASTALLSYATVGRKRIKLVRIARTTLKLGAHKRATVHLRLSKAAKRTLKRHRLHVTLTIVIGAKGRTSRTVTKRLVLRHKA
jgi:hypothetical protein